MQWFPPSCLGVDGSTPVSPSRRSLCASPIPAGEFDRARAWPDGAAARSIAVSGMPIGRERGCESVRLR
eukprot:gene14812-4820_t